MSNRYKGGVISATPPTTTGGESGTASGAWTLEQQMQLQAAGLWPAQPTGPYIEQVFSTYLYTGNGSTQTITNGIDLSGKGGMVWTKIRSAADSHILEDTVRGVGKDLNSNSTLSQQSNLFTLQSFTNNGYTVAQDSTTGAINKTYVSWTFRKQPKFFDVVTWTGNYPTDYPRIISHNLGSTPGCVMIKCTSNAGNWGVWHRSISTGDYNANSTLFLNSTAASVVYGNVAGPFTSTTIAVGEDLNQSGRTYVAYLFAHNAGGFGLTGTDNVISCGSFVTDAFGDPTTVNLGYEPQWVLLKSATSAVSWFILDNMRGWSNSSSSKSMTLLPNTSGAEAFGTVGADNLGSPTATGFTIKGVNAADTMIYIAIRRGPMKVPTSGTSVFIPVSQTGGGTVTTNFPVDLSISTARPASSSRSVMDRLRGSSTTSYRALFTDSAAVEDVGAGGGLGFDNNTGYVDAWNSSSYTDIYWNFRRAPGFFDEVCYTGTGSATTQTHNLGVVPELMILKKRNGGESWIVYTAPTGNSAALYLSSTAALETSGGAGYFNNTTPTATQFTVGNYTSVNSGNMIAYLFATLAGVSKVGSYTGTGALQTINCGFTGGARFVLIKRTDSTGNWWTYDSARGITSGNDPYLYFNNTAAEVTGTNYVDTDSTGFKVTAAAPAELNANGGTYIFLAVA